MRTDFIDYPTAWEIMKTSTLKHDLDCSTVAADFILCDCEAMPLEWARRASEAEPERREAIYEFVKDYLPGRFRAMSVPELIDGCPPAGTMGP